MSPGQAPLTTLPNLYLFGLPGVGKTFCGECLERDLGYSFHDGDQWLPEDLRESLKRGHGFTEEQRDRYVAEIARCIQVAKDMEQQEALRCGRPARPLAVAQATFKRRHRQQIGARHPEFTFVWIQANEEARLQRLAQRGSGVDAQLGQKMKLDFEAPGFEEKHLVFYNDQDEIEDYNYDSLCSQSLTKRVTSCMGKKAAGGGDREDPDKKLRIAIVNSDRCKPKKCKQECKTHCPVVRTGKLCVEVSKDSKISWISETLCIGCGICVKKCPFEAIQIINLPKDLSSHTTHRYGPNTFKLHRLPTPRPGQVLGLVGTNGIGKSTALMVLAGKLKPNLGRFDNPPDWQEIIQHFRGSELQSYIKGMLEDRLKAMIKPQYVDKLPKTIAGTVQAILDMKDEKKMKEHFCKELELNHLQEREIKDLSGGELQRFSIAVLCVQDAQVYMFDEPSSYLDVKQRIAAAQVVRSLQTVDNYIVVVEHDLAVLDYLSDFICCLWGSAGAYGVVTMPFSVREGINIFLDGFIPTENLRFREVSLSFKVSEDLDPSKLDRLHNTEYPMMTKKMGTFQLDIQAGNFASSEILVLLGQNGTGKTTFIRMLAGLLKPDDMKEGDELPELNVSYKPQTISAKFDGTVKDLFLGKIRDAFLHPQFQTDVTKPMLIDQIADHNVQTLSGGELQRVALVLSLGKPADIYLIDEPSAYLDVEQRVVAARVMKRFILHAKKTAFIVEHDFIMATYLADRVIVYDGRPGIHCMASAPMSLLEGMNKFLAQLEITFRRDPTNFRPRINKAESVKDREQKSAGSYFLLEE